MRPDQPILRLARQGEERLAAAAQELEDVHKHIEKDARVLYDVLAMVRSLIDELGAREAHKRILRACPELRRTVEALERASRQTTASAEDLDRLLSGDF